MREIASYQFISKDLFSGLKDAYKILQRRSGFPQWQCENAAMEVKRQTGLSFEQGEFRFDVPIILDRGPELQIAHCWNMDPISHVIVDLTLAQFSEYLHDPIPTGIIVVPVNSPLYNRYFNYKDIY